MNCDPAPEYTCGSTIADACVAVTVPVPECLTISGATCYRQSEVNIQVFTKVCAIDAAISTIQSSIDLSALTGCTGITPVKTTVKAEFQNIYDVLCGIKVDLSLPVPGLDLKCLAIPCNPAVPTLGGVLQAMINAVCCIGCAVPDASGCIDTSDCS